MEMKYYDILKMMLANRQMMRDAIAVQIADAIANNEKPSESLVHSYRVAVMAVHNAERDHQSMLDFASEEASYGA